MVKSLPAPKDPKLRKQQKGESATADAEAAATDKNVVDLTRENGLKTLIELCDDKDRDQNTPSNPISTDPILFFAENPADLNNDPKLRAPGRKQGSVHNDGDPVWKGNNQHNRPHKCKSKATDPTPAPEPMSELNVLKAKLLKAEQRIQKLESQKTASGLVATYGLPYPRVYPPHYPYSHPPPHAHPPLLPPPGYWPNPQPSPPLPNSHSQKQPTAPIRIEQYSPPGAGPRPREWVNYAGPSQAGQTRWEPSSARGPAPSQAAIANINAESGFVEESGRSAGATALTHAPVLIEKVQSRRRTQ
jgi:hypothetical protein